MERACRRKGVVPLLTTLLLLLLLTAGCAGPGWAWAEEDVADADSSQGEVVSKGEAGVSSGESAVSNGEEKASARAEEDPNGDHAASSEAEDVSEQDGGMRKVGVPTIEKTVSVNGGAYGKAAYASSWDQLGYRLEVQLPESFEGFDVYPLTVHDALPQGVSLDGARGVTVQVREAACEGEPEVLEDGWNTEWDSQSRVLSVSFPDVKGAGFVGGETIILCYSANLNPAATCGAANPNTNSAKVSYPVDTSGGIAESVPSVAHVHTFALTVHKRNEAGDALAGAVFELRDTAGVVRATLETDENGTASTMGMGPGAYVLAEKRAPAGYAIAQDSTLVIESAGASNAASTATATAAVAATASSTASSKASESSGIQSAALGSVGKSSASSESAEASAVSDASLKVAVDGAARLEKADANAGTVMLEVVDAASAAKGAAMPGSAAAAPAASSAGTQASAPAVSGGTQASAPASSSSLPKTGDFTLAFAAALGIVAALALVVASAARRRAARGREQATQDNGWDKL